MVDLSPERIAKILEMRKNPEKASKEENRYWNYFRKVVLKLKLSLERVVPKDKLNLFSNHHCFPLMVLIERIFRMNLHNVQ